MAGLAHGEGGVAAQKAIAEQDKYDFIVHSPELETWLDSLTEKDLTVKVSAVGVTLNRLIHWESVHRVIEMLDLHDSSDRSFKAEDDGGDFSRGPPSSAKPMAMTRGLP